VMLTKKLNEPLDRVVGVPDRQDLVVYRHVRSRPPDYRGDELIAVVLVFAAAIFGWKMYENKQEKLIAAPKNSSANSKGDAGFSCKIDGKDFSGKGTDQIGNAAYTTATGIISFVLMPIVAGQKGVPAQLAFKVANKGITSIHGTDNPAYSVRYTPTNTLDNDYQCKEITVTITSSGTSRVTGKFSGTLIEWKTERDVQVTDGKFDIPYSSYSKK